MTSAVKTVRVRLDADLWRLIEAEAVCAGVSVSQWGREALRAQIFEIGTGADQSSAETRAQARALRSEGQQARRKSQLLRERGHAVMQANLAARFDHVFRATPDFKEIAELDGRSRPQGFMNWLAEHVHPDDRDLVLAAVIGARGGTAVLEVEHRILRADRTTGRAVSRAVPLLGTTGQVSEWLVVSGEVTEARPTTRQVDRDLPPEARDGGQHRPERRPLR